SSSSNAQVLSDLVITRGQPPRLLICGDGTPDGTGLEPRVPLIEKHRRRDDPVGDQCAVRLGSLAIVSALIRSRRGIKDLPRICPARGKDEKRCAEREQATTPCGA